MRITITRPTYVEKCGDVSPGDDLDVSERMARMLIASGKAMASAHAPDAVAAQNSDAIAAAKRSGGAKGDTKRGK